MGVTRTEEGIPVLTVLESDALTEDFAGLEGVESALRSSS